MQRLCRLLSRCFRRGFLSSLLLAFSVLAVLSLLLLLHAVHLLHGGRLQDLRHRLSEEEEDPRGAHAAEADADGGGGGFYRWIARAESERVASGQRCVHPDLHPYHPSIMQFYQEEKENEGEGALVDCGSAPEDWVSVGANGTFRISRRARRLYGQITCEYAPIVRGDDFSARHAPHVKPMPDGAPLQSDFFKVACVSASGRKYMNIHSGVARNPAVLERLRGYQATASAATAAVGVGVVAEGGGGGGNGGDEPIRREVSELQRTSSLSSSSSSAAASQQGRELRPDDDRGAASPPPPPSPSPPPPPPSPPLSSPPLGLNLSVFMFGFDSLSRMAWLRLLPKTRAYFLQELGGTELAGYNIVGDGTPAALLPILTGKMEEELPEARRGFTGAHPVDGHPWIWREFSRRGYVTAHAEDMANVGTFQMRMLGFKEQPTDHNMRTFYLAAERMYKHNPPLCLGSRPRHVNFMNWFRDLFDAYRDFPKFFFGFHSEMSHDRNSKVRALDEDFVAFLRGLEGAGHLNQTLLILMADHGARYDYIRATAQGKLEERMPYFSFRFPPWFRRRHPDLVRNVELNSRRLTTPFDVHETLAEVLNYTGAGVADIARRGVSLFKEVPKARTCSHAGVTPHWCACLEWQRVNRTDELVARAARAAVDAINRFTEVRRTKCAELSLGEITRGARYVPNSHDRSAETKIVRYVHSNRPGSGSSSWVGGTASASAAASAAVAVVEEEELYQVSFKTEPGQGHFEVTCSRDVASGSFTVDPKAVSRINKYGTQPACVQDSMPHLRPYCYCS